ncbi:MAG: type I-U CRISPR-associated protein Csb2, partial [Opitutaceae bacterium]
MIHLEFRFPGGRYHATPWGHHVNEGLVEWPPSPWRLVRAFIATAFSKLSVPDPVPDEHPLRRLVDALSTQIPSYRMAPCPATHSRHYMPLGGKNAKTTLVLDTCAVPGQSPLIISWPVDLDAACTELLTRIVEAIGYLGRAESWAEGRVLSNSLPDLLGDLVEPHIEGMAKGPGWEQVSLLAPLPAKDYARCFEDVRREIEARFPIPEGKKKALAEERTKALAPHPVDLFACLTRDTAFLQQYGWSQPPGSRRVLYWRRANALAVAPAGRSAKHASLRSVEAILLTLASDTRRGEVLPQIARALPQAELLHRALVSKAGRGEAVDCPVLTGKDADGKPLTGHRHLHIVPLSLDEPGRLDHFLLWAPMGFDA